MQLGARVSVHPQPTDQAILRTSGAYRYLRHPMYSGVLVRGAAIAATAGTILHPFLSAMLLALLTAKARFEERLLSERFAGYASYAATRCWFLPFPMNRDTENGPS